MNNAYYERLKELARDHLHCNLDDNEPGYIPPDLKEKTYRWVLYIYSNLYKLGEDTIDLADREMFMGIAAFLRKEHLISWTRDTLIELDKEKVPQLKEYLLQRIHNTTSFYELKVCLHVLREVAENGYVIDQYIIDRSPGIKEFTIL